MSKKHASAGRRGSKSVHAGDISPDDEELIVILLMLCPNLLFAISRVEKPRRQMQSGIPKRGRGTCCCQQNQLN